MLLYVWFVYNFIEDAFRFAKISIKRLFLCPDLKQTRLSLLWKSKISAPYGTTANDDKLLLWLRSAFYRKFLRISNIKEKRDDDNSLLSFHFFHASSVGFGLSLLPWTLAHKVCHTHQMIYLFMILLISQMNEFMIHSPYPVLSLTLIKDRNDRL